MQKINNVATTYYGVDSHLVDYAIREIELMNTMPFKNVIML